MKRESEIAKPTLELILNCISEKIEIQLYPLRYHYDKKCVKKTLDINL